MTPLGTVPADHVDPPSLETRIEAKFPPSSPTATQVLDPVAQDTARTFGSGVYDAVVFHEGVVADASPVLCVVSTPRVPSVVTVESKVTTIPLSVGNPPPPLGVNSKRLGDRIPRPLGFSG